MRSLDNAFFWFWGMEMDVNLFMFIRSVQFQSIYPNIAEPASLCF